MNFNREVFEQAWSANMSSCRRTCRCGKVYWDGANSGYSWEPGEVEELHKDLNAKELPHSVSILHIEGTEFVADCDCWVPRAEAIWDWIENNGHAIATMINLKKRKATLDADRMPEVKP